MTAPTTVAEVVFPLPIAGGLDYGIPPLWTTPPAPGQRVLAPLGKKGLQVGVVTELKTQSSSQFHGELKSLSQTLDTGPALDEKSFELARWISRRYSCSFGEAVFAVLPIGAHRAPKRPSAPPLSSAHSASPSPHTLTQEQEAALGRILPLIREPRAQTFLLFGVAAAGKTEVYLRAIEETLRQGRSALYLVPEIGLTPQSEHWLKSRFGDAVDVWHSARSEGERWRVWRRILDGQCRVLLGPRSAVFAPLKNLGLLVVDEEHDASYKEETRPRFHAREVALARGRIHRCPVVLGSATPSLESFWRAESGEFQRLEMTQRVEARPFPRVTLVANQNKGRALISKPLVEATQAALDKKEQVLFFLNRRGYATYLHCLSCGWESRCPRCAISFTYHKTLPARWEGQHLRCHYCGQGQKPPTACPQCKSPRLHWQGKGTERVEDEIHRLWPNARVLRWDKDTTRRRHAHTVAYQSVQDESVDIVVGTKMVAQGLDFPRVTVVGVLGADRSLKFPDFRSAERTFQLLTQISGRAGRGAMPGEVFWQTSDTSHFALRAAAAFDYKAFAQEELSHRRELGYPPFARLAQVLFRSKNEDQAEGSAEEFMTWWEGTLRPAGIAALGPAPAFHHQARGVRQWQVMIKGPDPAFAEALTQLPRFRPSKKAQVVLDVDPEELG